MKVLLDTNVLIAAFVAHGNCHELFEYIIHHHQLVTSTYILEECRRNLRDKFHFTKEEITSITELISEKAEILSSVNSYDASVDFDDKPIVDAALTAQCPYLITGDKGLLQLKKVKNLTIISPLTFWKLESDMK